MSRRTFFIVILALFCLANVTRWGYRAGLSHPRFVAEGAAHFRYTGMIAGGKALPSIDSDAQHPEGLRVFRETTPGMEYLYGFVFRLLPLRDLAAFVRFFTAFVFSLAVFPIALLSEELWRSRRAGIVSALLFAVALPLVGRSSGFEFIRENLAFPLMIYHLYFFVMACGGRSRRDSLLAALFLLAAASTWQGTQFYLIPVFILLLVRRVFVRIENAEREAVLALAAAVLLAGAALPFLREGRFLLSLPAGLAYAWLASEAVSRVWGYRAAKGASMKGPGGASPDAPAALKAAAALLVMAVILLPGAAGGHFATYSHFFRMILYKLRYAHKPSDPAMLPFDVRAFWVGPFQSPDPRNIFVFALPLMALLPGPTLRLIKRARGGDFSAVLTAVFLLVSFILYALMMRLLPFFGIFAVLAAGGIVAGGGTGVPGGGAGGPKPAAARWSSVSRSSMALLAAVVAISLLQDFAWEGPADVWRRVSKLVRVPYREKFVIFPMEGDVEGNMLRWIARRTEERAVIMASHYLSPQILTYTGRPTNLNDFFESPRLRKKAERFLGLLYSSEDRLFDFCREQQSDYLLVSISIGCDPTDDSPLYQAGLREMPPGCAAYRLVFEPDRLSRFELVYENEMYRLFRVGKTGAVRRWPRSPLFYDSELLWKQDGDIRAFYYTVMRLYALTSRGMELARQGRREEAERVLSEVLRTHYFYPAWETLVSLGGRRRSAQERESLAELAYRNDPHRAGVCLELARARIALEKPDEARELLERCAGLRMSDGQREEVEGLLERIDQNR